MIIGRKAARRMVRGQLTVTFQIERNRPKVQSGRTYAINPRSMTGKGRPDPSIGRFRVKSVTLVRWSEITQDDAHAAGFVNRWELHKHLEKKMEGQFGDAQLFWRVEWQIIQVENSRAA